MSTTNIPEFKVLLVGEGGVGKRSFVRRFTADCDRNGRYINTLRSTIYPTRFKTNRGDVVFNVWIPPTNRDEWGLLQERCCIQADAAILMFDVTSRITFKEVPNWHRDLTRHCGNIPIVLCGNKVEIRDRKIKAKQIAFSRKRMNAQYYDMSVHRNYNLEKPFLWITRRLSGDASLFFVSPEQLAARRLMTTLQEAANEDMTTIPPAISDLAHLIVTFVYGDIYFVSIVLPVRH